jgi:hypothetical protein
MGVGGGDGKIGCTGTLLEVRDRVEKSPWKSAVECFQPTLWVGVLSVESNSAIEIFAHTRDGVNCEGGELEEAELLARMERWGEGGETSTVYIDGQSPT